jgi:hypothetical protein
MNVVQLKFFFPASDLSGSVELYKDADIRTIKKQFSNIFFNCFSEKKQYNDKRLFAYDSFNKSFNITALLNDKTTLETLEKKGFCFNSDYIILEWI